MQLLLLRDRLLKSCVNGARGTPRGARWISAHRFTNRPLSVGGSFSTLDGQCASAVAYLCSRGHDVSPARSLREPFEFIDRHVLQNLTCAGAGHRCCCSVARRTTWSRTLDPLSSSRFVQFSCLCSRAERRA